MKVIIGTKNQKKVKSVSDSFKSVLNIDNLDVISHDADSKMPNAPHDRQTYQGALNRAQECAKLDTADFYIGLESGLANRYDNLFEEVWAVIISKTGQTYIGYSSGLMLPKMVVDRMNSGELHDAIMKDLDRLLNLPDGNRDTWSRYTGGGISRQVSLDEALRNALLQLVPTQNNLYKQ